MASLEDEITELYSEPSVGASIINTYGEENIRNLLQMYRSLTDPDLGNMLELVRRYSQSGDLNTCYISVAVLHALGEKDDVVAAYAWAETQDDPKIFTQHFDIGVSLAEYLDWS